MTASNERLGILSSAEHECLVSYNRNTKTLVLTLLDLIRKQQLKSVDLYSWFRVITDIEGDLATSTQKGTGF